jgi:hypothetical protein
MHRGMKDTRLLEMNVAQDSREGEESQGGCGWRSQQGSDHIWFLYVRRLEPDSVDRKMH